MENYKKRAINLLIELALAKSKHPSVIPYIPQKTSVCKIAAQDLPRRLGGKNYKYSRILRALLEELEAEKKANIHSITVVKDSEIILEASAPGYDVRYTHLAHSMSKTVTGLALGFLYDEGKLSLDARVLDFFPEVSAPDEKYNTLTVYDLLTMRGGSGFAELGTVTEDKWTDAFFESKPAAKIGEEFSYNSINSYILGRIITKITGVSLYEYVAEKLFTPLSITEHFWENSPEGYTKGGFGLYLSPESFAKLGILILNNGTFRGERILSEEYVSKMCEPIADAPNSIGGFDYGMHVWVSPDGEEILFNGMLGQNVWIYPKMNVLAVVNCGNNELFSDSPTLAVLRRNLKLTRDDYTATRADYKHLKTAIDVFFNSRRNVVPKNELKGLLYFFGIKERRPFLEEFTPLLGKYAARSNNSGILPLFVSVMQNNYSGGIETFDFWRDGEKLIFTSVEGGTAYDIPIGLYGYEESVLDFSGEKYIVRASAEVLLDEERHPIFKIELIFPELPNVRIIKITHTDEGILVRMSEMPNERIAETYFETLTSGGKGGFILGLIEKKMGEGFIKEKISSIFNPELPMISTLAPGFEERLRVDNERIAEKNERSASLLKSLASKFLSDSRDESENNDRKSPSIGSFFKSALSLLLKVARVKPEDTESDGIIEIPDDTITFLDSPTNDALDDENG